MAKAYDMTSGSPVRLMVKFALPMMAGNAFQLAYGIVDAWVVGRLIGVGAFASVTATGFCYWMLFSAILGLTQGFGTLMAQRFGAKDGAGLRRAIGVSALLTTVVGVSFSLVGALCARPLMELLGTPEDILPGAALYMAVMAGGMLITAAYNLLGAILRSLGDSRTPLTAMILASIVNVALDVMLVLWTGWGIAAVAIATLLAQIVASAYCLKALLPIREARPDRSDYQFDGPMARALLRLGLPGGLRNMITASGGLVVQYAINGYGTLFVAGFGLANKLYGFMEIVGGAMDGALAVFVAQNFGARQLERIRRGVWDAGKILIVSAILITALLWAFGEQLMVQMVSGELEQIREVMRVARTQLRVMLIGLPFLYYLFMFRSALSGMGNAAAAMASGFVEMGVRLACVLVLTRFIGEWGAYLAVAAGWPVAMAQLWICYVIEFRKQRTQLAAKRAEAWGDS